MLHDPLLVSGFERIANLSRDAQRFFQRNGARCDQSGESRPPDQLHHQVVRTHVVQGADVGVIQRRDGASLALETFGELLARYLNRDGPIEAAVEGPVHLSHTASANRQCHLVRPEALAGSERGHSPPDYGQTNSP